MEEINLEIYDFIILGTGFQQSVLSASLSRLGKKVLHFESNDFYGEAHASLDLQSLTASLGLSRCSSSNSDVEQVTIPSLLPACSNPRAIVETLQFEDDSISEGHVVDDVQNCLKWRRWNPTSEDSPLTGWLSEPKVARAFSLPLIPKFVFSSSPMLKMIIRSGTHKYLDFLSLDRSLCVSPDDQSSSSSPFLLPVPHSRAAVFSASFLSLKDKRALMRALSSPIFKTENNEGEDAKGEEGTTGVTPSSATSEGSQATEQYTSFEHLLDSLSLSPSLRKLIQYCLALDDGTLSSDSSSVRPRVETMQRYLMSVGVYGPSPFLLPVYGTGEIPQAFCRVSAVYGGVFMLRQKIESIRMAPDSVIAECGFQSLVLPNDEESKSKDADESSVAHDKEPPTGDQGTDEKDQDQEQVNRAAKQNADQSRVHLRKLLDESMGLSLSEESLGQSFCGVTVSASCRAGITDSTSSAKSSEAKSSEEFYRARCLVASSAYLPSEWYEAHQTVCQCLLISAKPFSSLQSDGASDTDDLDHLGGSSTQKSAFVVVPPQSRRNATLSQPVYAIVLPPSCKVAPKDHYGMLVVTTAPPNGGSSAGPELARQSLFSAVNSLLADDFGQQPSVSLHANESTSAKVTPVTAIYFSRSVRVPSKDIGERARGHGVVALPDPPFDLTFDAELAQAEALFHQMVDHDLSSVAGGKAPLFMEQVPDPEDIIFT